MHQHPIIQQQLQKQISQPGKTGLDWYLFCYFLNKFKNQPMLEIGAGNGGSLYTMCAFSRDITVIDSWDFGWSQDQVRQTLADLECQVVFQNTRSEKLSKLDKTYNFIHLDANKSYEGTQHDLELTMQACKGIICVDDYMNSVWPEVTWAVDDALKNNSAWNRLFVGNHQTFLTNVKVGMQDLVVDWPLVNRADTWYLTYGDLPECVDTFVQNGKMTYSWQDLVWGNQKELL